MFVEYICREYYDEYPNMVVVTYNREVYKKNIQALDKYEIYSQDEDYVTLLIPR